MYEEGARGCRPHSKGGRFFDLGKAGSFVIEKALEVFTQVDQQMIAVS